MSDIQLPAKLVPVFANRAAAYKGSHGGRGSGKTRSFAKMSAVFALAAERAGHRGSVLAVRQYQNSLDESSLLEVQEAIRETPWLLPHFDLGQKYVRTRTGGVKYVFRGLHANIDSIKSLGRVLLTWAEEAENLSADALRKLLPTVMREPVSEFWATWNPERDGSPIDKFLRKAPPRNSHVVEVNYADNPWFPPGLEDARAYDRENLDDQTYAWIWEGAYRENSVSQILAGKYRVAEFLPGSDWAGPYYGVDWGFSQDPTAGVKLWVNDNCLYVEYEAYRVGLELDATADHLIATLPGIERHAARADNARPESISHVRSSGTAGNRRSCLPRLVAARKWPGSVEDGIAHLRSYREIVIHPRCAHAVFEARAWSYKTDRLTGDVLPIVLDAHNHIWDATRYALEPLVVRRGGRGILLPRHVR